VQRVLVLEDDENLREVLVDVVDSLDYEVHQAESAAVALRLGNELDFDLIISDIRMAGPTDGLGVLQELKQRRPNLACIVITGFADQLAPARALQIKVDDYLYKPFEVEDIVQAIERVRKSAGQRTWYRQVLYKFLGKVAPQQALAELQSTRENSLKTLFVAVRSDYLYAETALAAWDTLEDLDIEYLKACNEGAISSDTATSLQSRYQLWQAKLAKDASSKAFVAPAQRSPDKVERATFREFLARIKSAKISAEELSVAVTLRKMPRDRRQRSPELEKLYRRMWGT